MGGTCSSSASIAIDTNTAEALALEWEQQRRSSACSQASSVSRKSMRKRLSNRLRRKSSFAGNDTTPKVCPLHAMSDDILLIILSYISYAPGETAYSRLDADGLMASYNREVSIVHKRGNKGMKDCGSTSFGSSDIVKSSSFGTLTHVLPLVCREWYVLCHAFDMLWKEAIIRLGRNNEDWRVGLELSCKNGAFNKAVTPSINGKGESASSSLTQARQRMAWERLFVSTSSLLKLKLRTEIWNHGRTGSYLLQKFAAANPPSLTFPELTPEKVCAFQQLFQEVLQKHVWIRGPVFLMPEMHSRNVPGVGDSISLHLYEPRYRLLIDEVMSDRSVDERNGAPIPIYDGSTKRRSPRFVVAYERPLGGGSLGCMVEVRRCVIHPNGTADVVLVVADRVYLAKVTERPDSGRLYDALVHRVWQ